MYRQIGTTLKGPRYVPLDEAAIETEFIEQVISTWDEIDPLCNNTLADNCRFVNSLSDYLRASLIVFQVWHNHFLAEDGIWDPYNPEGINHV